MKVVTSAHNLKKEYLRLDIFCFEITHTQVRRYEETSADLAGNFKLTNHMAVEANKRRKQTRKSVRILFRIVSSLPLKYLPFFEEKWSQRTSFPSVIEAKPSNKMQFKEQRNYLIFIYNRTLTAGRRK